MTEPLACPHCGVVLTEVEVKRLWGQYGNASRKVKSGGRPKNDFAATLREMRENAATHQAETGPDSHQPQPEVLERVAGLRTLLQHTETRVGMGEIPPAQSWPSAPISRGETRHPQDVEAEDVQQTPYQQSENRRAWAIKLNKLKALGEYDPGGAAEEFSELVKGHKLPQGFSMWREPKKVEWLLENVELKED